MKKKTRQGTMRISKKKLYKEKEISNELMHPSEK